VCARLNDGGKKLNGRNLRNRTLVAPENDFSEGQSHGLSELDGVDCELMTPNNECAIAVRKLSTRHEGNMSMAFLLRVGRSFKADVATALEMLNCNFISENTNLAKDISSRMTSQFT
jgi:hypothetical protein